MFGRAKLFLEYAAKLKGDGTTADDLAFKRNEREFSNLILCEQPNGNFADTIVRQFFLDAFYKLFFKNLLINLILFFYFELIDKLRLHQDHY